MSHVLHCGKMEVVLLQYPDNHFDAIVTDPPYGLGKEPDPMVVLKDWIEKGYHAVKGNGFMGNQWDSFVLQPLHWKQVYRVLKPGGHLISFSSSRTYDWMLMSIRLAGFESRDMIEFMFSSGFPKSKNNHELGLGSALKPAHEPIALCRKPLEGTLAENFAKWGTGYLNIDACRIPGTPWTYGSQPDIRNAGFTPGKDRPGVHAKNVVGGQEGRWPANLLHDGSDEVLSVFPVNDTPSGPASGPTRGKLGTQGRYGPASGDMGESAFYGDTGSAARFFYHAKTSRQDRNDGCEQMDKQPLLWSSGTQNPGSFQSAGTDRSSQNNWPTVKPTNLMRYLIRLVARKDQLILDPCMGSGSTLKAAAYEFVNAVGIDKQPETLPIAEARIQYAYRHRDTQINIFD